MPASAPNPASVLSHRGALHLGAPHRAKSCLKRQVEITMTSGKTFLDDLSCAVSTRALDDCECCV